MKFLCGRRLMSAASAFFFVFATLQAHSFDWPMWGYDEGRTNYSSTELPDRLELLWTRKLPEPRRAWRFQQDDYTHDPTGVGKLSFDVSYEPVAGGGRLYVSSMVSDSVSAYSAESGEELWSYYTGGPVRFAPAYFDEKLYFTSDDGYLYCVKACSGELNWKFKGSYSDRKVLGNERLISAWPARGGPVISDGIVYFASGVFPFEGIFIHAVCVESGEAEWTNSTSGFHGPEPRWDAGPSPQGYLAVSGDRLIVPGGRTPPAVYDRNTGEFLYFRRSATVVGKGPGGYRVHARDGWFFNHGFLYSLEDGAQYGPVPGSVLTENSFIGASSRRHDDIRAISSRISKSEVIIKDRLQRFALNTQYDIRHLWVERDITGIRHAHFKSGSHLGFSKDGGAGAIFRLGAGGEPEDVVWEHDFDSEIWSMITAYGRLYVTTESGSIYCFGEGGGREAARRSVKISGYTVNEKEAGLAEELVALTGKKEGYAVVAGGSGGFLAALADMTELHIVAVDTEGEIPQLRRGLDLAGLYGRRIAVIEGGLTDSGLPPYFVELVVLAGVQERDNIERAYELLRPYGGRMYVAGRGREIADTGLENAGFEFGRDFALIERRGPLLGAGRWTHQYACPSNTAYSDDELAKPPLGVLWFGGPTNENILPRHYSGPVPQVVGGRLFILGVETLSARCVYTGRELWVRELPGIGHPFTNLELEERFRAGSYVYMTNHPGANAMGSPYVSLEDGVYVVHRDAILRLDPSSGQTLSEFRLPLIEGIERKEWGHVMVYDDYLIAAAGPQIFTEGEPDDPETWWNATSSSHLVVMDRHEGRRLWVRSADQTGYRHNAIAAGNGRLYAVDGLSEHVVEKLRRRGLETEALALILAMDIETGDVLWEDGAFGTWLGYYEEKDILLEGGRRGGKRSLPDEPWRNLTARRGENGDILWDYRGRYLGPLGLHPDMIIPGRQGQDILDPGTGRSLEKEHPVTGERYPFKYHRYYGCGTMNYSRYLIKFRSGSAGYTDLFNFGGTGNFGGFRAGCTNNLVAADGVLNAPDYTRTCTCSYPLQTSLGLIHIPESEMWTLNRLPRGLDAVDSVGINFGAPGNRREDGVLWLEYPKVYAEGPEVFLDIEADQKTVFRNHASWILNPDDGYAWVASYGLEGIQKVSLELVPLGAREGVYDVELYFAEPGGATAGERFFDVFVQGEKVLEGFDIAKLLGASRQVARVELNGIPVEENLDIVFSAGRGSLPAVISGVKAARKR